jgi:hypothetical protein
MPLFNGAGPWCRKRASRGRERRWTPDGLRHVRNPCAAGLSLDDRFHESCHKRGIHL